MSVFELEQLRADTPGCANRIHLNNAGAALLSRTTLAAMTDYLHLEAAIGGYEAAEESAEQIAGTYHALARLLNANSSEIALFDNSTHAWNAAFYSVPLHRGDRILTGRNEYGSNVLAYLQTAERHGVEVVVVPDDDHGQLDTAALTELIDERVKLIGLTWVPTGGGLVNPAAEVGRIANAANILYLLDATQAVGQFPIDVAALGCDFLTGTGRKYLRGPRGTGFLYAREAALPHIDPYVAEIASAHWDGHRSFSWAAGARRFETWEYSYMNVVGLGSAVSQALDLGVEAIGQRTRRLGAQLRAGLRELATATVHDLGEEQCALVTATVSGHSSAQVADELARHAINVDTTVAEHNQFDTEQRDIHPLVRLSPHYYNTEDEIARTIDVLASL
ncbi:aminotransferase class V-fold PLP-dependent enzyme [Nocardia brasiliensis]|uniref:aminotransferase class V-fold PLP-dependent enzyme n=1 Tax=Nocardia brasiliensis TaxID=37326 RepID=UPI00245683B1|nr:aminotransferase class V-fold PLP-dependent enzyme [Nocardia brasiliensis]